MLRKRKSTTYLLTIHCLGQQVKERLNIMENENIRPLVKELRQKPEETKRIFKELGEKIKEETTFEEMIEQIFKHSISDIFDIYWPDTVRICRCCGKIMQEGYVWYGVYYCSEECLKWGVPEKEIKEEREIEDNEDCYYTEWY